MRKFPFPFFLAFLTYSLILFIEKVAFNSHALIDHNHGDHGHSHSHGHDHGHDHHNHGDHEETEKKHNKSNVELDTKNASRELCNFFINR
jgi:hypothetical protein